MGLEKTYGKLQGKKRTVCRGERKRRRNYENQQEYTDKFFEAFERQIIELRGTKRMEIKRIEDFKRTDNNRVEGVSAVDIQFRRVAAVERFVLTDR